MERVQIASELGLGGSLLKMGEIDLKSTCSFFAISFPDEKITLRRWDSGSDCEGYALLVHGLGAHSGWFEATGRRLAGKGLVALSYDHRGFGSRKSLKLGSYADWIDDLIRVYKHISQTEQKPVYIFANSMGALVSVAAILQEPAVFEPSVKLPGLVMFSPGFDGYPGTFTLSYRLRAILSAIFQPQKPVALPYGPEAITRDTSVHRWIAADPDHLSSVPGSMLLELLKLTRRVESNFPLRLKVPVLMATAGMERIVNPSVNKRIFDRMIAPSKQCLQFDDAYHDLMFAPELDDVVDAVIRWRQQVARTDSNLVTG